MKIKLKELNTGFVLEKKVKKLSPKQRAISIVALTLVAVFLVTFLFSAMGILPYDAISARISTGLFGGGKNLGCNVPSAFLIVSFFFLYLNTMIFFCNFLINSLRSARVKEP